MEQIASGLTSGRPDVASERPDASVRWVNCDLLYPLPFLPCGRLSGRLSGQRSGRPGARPSGRLDGRSLMADGRADGLADGGTDDRAGGRHADN